MQLLEDLQLIKKTGIQKKITLEISKKITFLLVINNPIIYTFFKAFTNQ